MIQFFFFLLALLINIEKVLTQYFITVPETEFIQTVFDNDITANAENNFQQFEIEQLKIFVPRILNFLNLFI